MRIRYSRRAIKDLTSTREYLSERSLIGADNVLAAIYAAVEFVRRHPQASETTHIAGVRGKLVHKYRFKLFYRVLEREDLIEIVHIRHMSRRPWIGEEEDNESEQP